MGQTSETKINGIRTVTSPEASTSSPTRMFGDLYSKYPCSQLKLDNLFLQWLSMPQSQQVVQTLSSTNALTTFNGFICQATSGF